MAQELQPIDIEQVPTTSRLVEEVGRGDLSRLLKRGDQELAVISPIKPPVKRARKPRRDGVIAEDDPILQLAGTGRSGIPGGISERKYDVFKEAFGPDA